MKHTSVRRTAALILGLPQDAEVWTHQPEPEPEPDEKRSVAEKIAGFLGGSFGGR